jgi:hypothetical protein
LATEEIHVGDIGTVFKITFKDGTSIIDISGATTKNIIFCKPDGTKATKAGTFTTDGTDGILQYTTVTGDLNIQGVWKIQGFITTTSGSWYSSIGYFEVYKNVC